MPTGYTAGVADGTLTDLRDFALQCARGMGALIMMRDAAWDAPIPERFEPSDFYSKELEKVQEELKGLRAMKPEEWQTAADAERAERVAAFERAKADRDEQRYRYQAMIDKVQAWSGAPEGIKAFMLSQLRESIQFDCPEPFTWYQPLDPIDGETWKQEREIDLINKSARYASEQQKENDRTEGRNAWLAQLRASLGDQ